MAKTLHSLPIPMTFVPGQVLANRYCLYRPFSMAQGGRQTWQAWDLSSH